MPIALERGAGIGRAAPLRRIGCFPIPPETAGLWPAAGRKLAATPPPLPMVEDSSSDSSSIGVNSDGESEGEEEEVQSVPKGPLEVMEALEEALPIRRGISDFYRGKSKSFTNLADGVSSCSSSKDLAKHETAHTRKRRNILALKRSRPPRSTGGRGISKKHPNSNRSTLALAVAMFNPGSSNNTNSEEGPDHHQLLPPLHSQGKPTAASGVLFGSFPSHEYSMHIRSFSLPDLQGMAGSSPEVKQGGERNML